MMASLHDAIERSKRKADIESSSCKVSKKTRGQQKSITNMAEPCPVRMTAEPNAQCSKELVDPVLSLLHKLVDDQKKLSDKLDTMQSDMVIREERIMSKIEEKLDITKNLLKQDIIKVNNDLQSQIDGISHDVNNLKDSINLCKIVIKNVSESDNEDCLAKVNEFVKVGLKLTDTKVVSAKRIPKRQGSQYPGIIVAEVRESDRTEIFKRKPALKQSAIYSNIYVNDFISNDAQKMNSNLQTVLRAVGKQQDFNLVNGRILPRNPARVIGQSAATPSQQTNTNARNNTPNNGPQ
ncbi:unnamed protein product [Owenia fusiformis]|uniref:Uncharacterized protein n=1 Tax=Owenia fusiformis TaxID=6347 RepID=A0A8J1XVP3_OWEFU|nr:unnamed protein product [Owenia fusiformis]